jgi:hypothetical protein
MRAHSYKSSSYNLQLPADHRVCLEGCAEYLVSGFSFPFPNHIVSFLCASETIVICGANFRLIHPLSFDFAMRSMHARSTLAKSELAKIVIE